MITYCICIVELTTPFAADKQRFNSAAVKAIERNLMSKCISSMPELADIVSQAMHYWYVINIYQSLLHASHTEYVRYLRTELV